MLTLFSLFALSGVVTVVYGVCLVIWRIYLSPLSKFPGPKIAAATLWYEFYFDIVKEGKYIWEIEHMHKVYGPVVRISPFELHINDPDFYDEIYTSASRPRDKYEWQIKSGDSAQAMGFTVSHNLHRMRRTAVDHFFSTRSVAQLEHVVQERIQRLCERIEEFKNKQTPLNLTVAFLALTMDVIETYSFGVSSNLLDLPEFSPEWRDTITAVMSKTALMNHFGWIPKIVKMIPQSVLEKQEPAIAKMNGNLVQSTADLKEHELKSTKRYRTIFEEIRNDPDLPPQEKTTDRLTDEATILVIAASETPAKSLSLIIFHLLRNPEVLAKARQELSALSLPTDEMFSLPQLEPLPYLSAIIKEGLRLHGGIVARSQRVAKHETLHCAGFDIPPGTPLSTSSYCMHRNPAIFPKPSTFLPERWLAPEINGGRQLERYLVAWGKGTRSCVGKNLGQAELYITLAEVIRRFDFTLFETDEGDVEIGRDWYVMQPEKNSPGVRVTVN
ncbi:putative cytochrome P450 [Byssothecium circinans]|uniref:Putative cytochrome P450 n=1 Tax=Byssothecium circinans TaxID=147558 RepID=A0A6A5TAD3_9PLEO|nr:putative cytochrome P450 [Byssothecium circinans]